MAPNQVSRSVSSGERAPVKRLASILAICLVAGTGVQAAIDPRPGAGDPRMRWVRYDPDQVVNLRGAMGYQFPIQFGEDERIENVSIGDGTGWQVTPNHRADVLFLKPMMPRAVTNMTVFTNLRRYNFMLSVQPRGVGPGLFGLRFEYPVPALAIPVVADAPQAPVPPQDHNHAYSYSGSRRNVPDRLFDDGHFTYFRFGDAAEYPAIFVNEGPKRESMAATSMRDGYVVVDQLAPRFVLRRGDDVTTIVNDGFVEPAPGPLAPLPRGKKK
jgi:type IV secretion system protein VirB9